MEARTLLVQFTGEAKYISDKAAGRQSQTSFRESHGLAQSVMFTVSIDDLLSGRIRMERFHMINRGVRLSSGDTGKIAIWGSGADVSLASLPGRRWRLRLSLTLEVLYRAMQELVEPVVDSDSLETPREIFEGVLEAELMEGSRSATRSFSLSALNLRMSRTRSVLGWFRGIEMSLDSLNIRVPVLSGIASNAQLARAISRKRRLKLQPVGFRENDQDQDPTGGSWDEQFRNAKMLWESEDLEIFSEPIRYLDRSDLKESKEITTILNSWEDLDDCRTIEVFLVRSVLPNGGGFTRGCGSGLDNVVISDLTEKNRFLLAHEIGHVLSGWHPGEKREKKWTADDGTVLTPTYSLQEENPGFNTDYNRQRACNFAIDGAWCPV